MPKVNRPVWSVLTAISISLSGCATKDTLLPQTGPTMKEVYDAHFRKTRRRSGAEVRLELSGRGPGTGDLAGFTREQQTEIFGLFPRLPNPDLVMYVFPHLSPNGHPVPGYATVFPMYETTQYALPGEEGGW